VAPLSMPHRPRRRGRVALKPSRRAASPVPGRTRTLRPASRRSVSLSSQARRYGGVDGRPRGRSDESSRRTRFDDGVNVEVVRWLSSSRSLARCLS
jgi:hypothetical protein